MKRRCPHVVICGLIYGRRCRAPTHAQPLMLGLAPRLAEDDHRRSTRLSGDEARLPALGSAPRALKCDSNRRTAPAPRAVKRDHSARTGLALGCAGPRLSRLDCSQLLILLIAISSARAPYPPTSTFRSTPPAAPPPTAARRRISAGGELLVPGSAGANYLKPLCLFPNPNHVHPSISFVFLCQTQRSLSLFWSRDV